jgi:hypothetical protein
MPEYFFVTAMPAPSGVARSRPCATLDNALRGANFMLGNGAASVCIVDSDDNLVLTAEQVRLRLKQPTLSQTRPTKAAIQIRLQTSD